MKTYYEFIKENNLTFMPFVISKRLRDLLLTIDHPIAQHILSDAQHHTRTDKATLIDIDDNRNDSFTYTLPSRVFDELKAFGVIFNDATEDTATSVMQDNDVLYEKDRTSMRVGRLVNKLYPEEYSNRQIESFVDAVKTRREKKNANFKIVQGQDIAKYYLWKSYDPVALDGSALGGSCMRHEECQSYIQFYAQNKDVSLLVLMSKDDKIYGRALLWNIADVNSSAVRTVFMDRVYYSAHYQAGLFINYAKENEWYHKKFQNSDPDTEIWNPKTSAYEPLSISTVNTFYPTEDDLYPYMDTMKYFYPKRHELSNVLFTTKCGEPIYKLESLDGQYEDETRRC